MGRKQRFLGGVIAAAASLFGLKCGKGASPSGRYEMAADPGARQSSRYVRDRVTGEWVYREFELRVDTVRPLPEPLRDSEHGDRLSLQLFEPGMTKSGGLRSGLPVVEQGYRIWRGADILKEADLRGTAAYGVRISWPRKGEETRHDPLEIFPLLPLGETEPGVWSPWFTASSLREGGFGWWEEVHGKPLDSLPRPEHPFEFRWKLMLDEVPGRLP
jgi:hypothetical protein